MYEAQIPRLVDGTIRENVLFGIGVGHPLYSASGLQSALDASQISNDFQTNGMRSGQNTAVGPRGGNISGGQRSRVALARAVYAVASGGAQSVLLDDPVASLDGEIQNGSQYRGGKRRRRRRRRET